MSIVPVRIGFKWLIVAGLIAVTVMAVWTWGVLPVHNWADQRAAIERLEVELQQVQSSNAALQTEVLRLETDDEIERIARRDFGLVYPGEEAYAILPQPRPAVEESAAEE